MLMGPSRRNELGADALAALGGVLLIVLVRVSGHTALAVIMTVVGSCTGVLYIRNSRRLQDGD